MSRWLRCMGVAVVLWAMSAASQADELFMVRSGQSFPEAMSTLQQAITDHGYTLARVQRVDIGLTGSGFQTDKYRIVFFGKPEEIRRLSRLYPQLIPYLPLQLTIFAEGEETLVVTANPVELRALASGPELEELFRRWSSDIRAILEDVRNAE